MGHDNFGSDIVKLDNKFVYHYCSLDAFLGIVRSKSIWLTSLDSTNDTTETKIARIVIKKALNNLYNELLESSSDNQGAKKLIGNLININNTYSHINSEYFSFSFSSSRDNLVMWDRYDKDFKGICLKFNLLELDKILNLHLKIGGVLSGKWLSLTQIAYKEEDQVNLVTEYIKYNLDAQLKYYDDTDNPDFLKSIYNYFCPTLKHNDFKEEGEFRIIIVRGLAEKFLRDFKETRIFSSDLGEYINELRINESNIKFGNFNSNIKAYFSLNLEKIWSSSLIKEVIIGKYSNQDCNELKRFLLHNNLKKTKITHSKVVYKK